MKQHVSGPTTHQRGHTLDLIITRESDDFLTVSKLFATGYLPSDHHATIRPVNIGRPDPVKMEITTPKLKNINVESFCQDILSSPLYTAPSSDLDSLITQYESVLAELLNTRQTRSPYHKKNNL